ncbi:unnamed protein product [Paramecium sonneborni]|uniref:UBX domain-containing protein n=1 Tax=Paramecium sonneborni TaxID=65129 RepID=A0A8S1LSN4_9CILI|nr:unnamed protein product [Paramecium sonneborni]
MQQDQQLVKKFSEITGCKDQMKCIHYLQMNNNELERAIQLYLDLEIQQQEDQNQQEIYHQQIIPQQQKKQIKQEFQLEKTQATQNLILKYQQYKESKMEEDDNLVSNVWKIAKAIFTKNQNYGEEFQKNIQSKKIKIEIKFEMGSFQDNIKKAQNKQIPLFVYAHDVSGLKILENMFQCKTLVKFVNRSFISYAFIGNEETLVQLPTQNIELPSILIYRINFIDEICLMKQIKLFPQTNFEELAKEIKQIAYAIYKIRVQENLAKNHVDNPEEISQSQIEKFSQRQIEMEKKKQQEIQQREREELLQNQEMEYLIAVQKAEDKKKRIQDEKLKQEQLIQEQQWEEEQRQFIKASQLSSLPEEPIENGISIQLRFFDKVLTRKFNLTDKIESIFDFVMCQDDSLFMNPKAQIDLIQNFPRLSLIDKKNMTIQEIFNDSTGEQLIILEMD